MPVSREQELLAVVRAWDLAMIQNDAGEIGRFMAEDWTIIGSDGGSSDKDTFLALVRSGTLSHDTMESEEVVIRLYGDAAVVMARGVSGGTFNGQPFRELEQQSNVFIRDASGWHCVLTHLSRLASPGSSSS
ncbi:MAG: nuclear transport factor 2 family protein [Steroidobacteraceae bacterium]